MTQEENFDDAWVGKELPPVTIRVERDAILRYCRSTGMTDPIHTDDEAARAAGYRGLVVPITMFTQMVRDEQPRFRRRFHGMGMGAGTAFEVLAPVCAGDVVEAATHVKDVFTKTGRSGTMTFVLLETILTDQPGNRVVTVTESFVKMNGAAPTSSRQAADGNSARQV